MSNEPDILAYDQAGAARVLSVSVRTIRQWTRSGKLSPVKLGPQLLRYPADEVRKLIEQAKAK